jgi:hypothetical protein
MSMTRLVPRLDLSSLLFSSLALPCLGPFLVLVLFLSLSLPLACRFVVCLVPDDDLFLFSRLKRAALHDVKVIATETKVVQSVFGLGLRLWVRSRFSVVQV